MWNPEKELKVMNKGLVGSIAEARWNPEKELKGIVFGSVISMLGSTVESGEGIERKLHFRQSRRLWR